MGLRGEARSTLEMLGARGTRCILGLRDVMDEPASLVDEWQRKMVFPALERLYDEIWVYGLPRDLRPVARNTGHGAAEDKVRFTGYLRRSAPEAAGPHARAPVPERAYIWSRPAAAATGRN